MNMQLLINLVYYIVSKSFEVSFQLVFFTNIYKRRVSEIERDMNEFDFVCYTPRRARMNLVYKFHLSFVTLLFFVLPNALVRSFVSRYVGLDGGELDKVNADGGILLSGHYGYFFITALSFSQKMELFNQSRDANLYSIFDSPKKNKFNRVFIAIYKKIENISCLDASPKSLVRAIKAARRGEIVSTFPDVFDFSESTKVRYFLGKLCYQMDGTSFLIEKAKATRFWVTTSFRRRNGFTSQVTSVTRFADDDVEGLGQRVFTELSETVYSKPQYWQYWGNGNRHFLFEEKKGESYEERVLNGLSIQCPFILDECKYVHSAIDSRRQQSANCGD